MLPVFTDRQSGEISSTFGQRALLFVLRHRCTATMSDEALEQALHASVYAVMPHDLQQAVVALISSAKMEISATLARRASEAEREVAAQRQARLMALAQQASLMRPLPGLDGISGGGSRVPVIPQPPTLPSGGVPLAPPYRPSQFARGN